MEIINYLILSINVIFFIMIIMLIKKTNKYLSLKIKEIENNKEENYEQTK